MSFNKIIVVGNLGRDPELRYTPQGDAVCDFSVAVNDKKRDKAGELQDVVTWFRITLWRRLAENASKYLTKGKQVYIEGRLQVDEWQDRDGTVQKRHAGSDLGGTMRLGAQSSDVKPGTLAHEIYGGVVTERHRHRYEANSHYLERLEQAETSAFQDPLATAVLLGSSGGRRGITCHQLVEASRGFEAAWAAVP